MTTTKVKLRGSNLKYDLVWITTKWGIECTNFKFDNCVAGSLLDENRSNSLNLHAKVMTAMGGYDDAFNDKWSKDHMERVPPGELLPYQGGDIEGILETSSRRLVYTKADDGLAQSWQGCVFMNPAVRWPARPSALAAEVPRPRQWHRDRATLHQRRLVP